MVNAVSKSTECKICQGDNPLLCSSIHDDMYPTQTPEDEKLILFGWVTTVLGLPTDPTKYNELADKLYEYINTWYFSKETVIDALDSAYRSTSYRDMNFDKIDSYDGAFESGAATLRTKIIKNLKNKKLPS